MKYTPSSPCVFLRIISHSPEYELPVSTRCAPLFPILPHQMIHKNDFPLPEPPSTNLLRFVMIPVFIGKSEISMNRLSADTVSHLYPEGTRRTLIIVSSMKKQSAGSMKYRNFPLPGKSPHSPASPPNTASPHPPCYVGACIPSVPVGFPHHCGYSSVPPRRPTTPSHYSGSGQKSQ